jgi:hypothetical protein
MPRVVFGWPGSSLQRYRWQTQHLHVGSQLVARGMSTRCTFVKHQSVALRELFAAHHDCFRRVTILHPLVALRLVSLTVVFVAVYVALKLFPTREAGRYLLSIPSNNEHRNSQ